MLTEDQLTEVEINEMFRLIARFRAEKLCLTYQEHENFPNRDVVKLDAIQKVNLEEFLSECKIPVRLTSTKRRAKAQK